MKKVMYHAELLGMEIMNLRKKAGLTQEELAWRTGLSRSQISRIERGLCITSEETLRKIEDGLGLSSYYLNQVRGEYIQDENVDCVLTEVKADVLHRELSEKSIRLIAHLTKAIADVLEEFEGLTEHYNP